ncbi:universal stress protein [Litoribacter ruber]|uniref:universal stress protein n=1 Tax=Litoribacter ruber TaxID=702568 RepID=UPI001BDA70A5|nr:universal stress protein [Litoribacter ruber]MBT0812117.1 universal stress protein [Litoribacter ruber]
MKQFQKVLVGLDLTEMDQILIEKTGKLVDLLGIEKIYFVHVEKDLALPTEVIKTYPDLLAPVDEAIERSIREKAQKFIPAKVEIDISVKEGDPMATILRWSKIKNIDLLIMGRKIVLEGSGTLSKNLAQKAPCSVLFLTENLKVKEIDNFLVPVDFSEYSHLTLSLMEELAQKFKAKITCLHIYEVPKGYYKTGKSYEEFAQIMLKNAQKEYGEFIRKNKLPEYDCKYVLKEDKHASKYILEVAKGLETDMILMGSRGRTDSAALLIGSVAERLVHLNYEIPMLIYKTKGENMGFLEALFKV